MNIEYTVQIWKDRNLERRVLQASGKREIASPPLSFAIQLKASPPPFRWARQFKGSLLDDRFGRQALDMRSLYVLQNVWEPTSLL